MTMDIEKYKYSDESIDVDSEPVDLWDVILGGLGEVVMRASKAFGSKSYVAGVSCESFHGDVEIEKPAEDPVVSFEQRIWLVCGSCRYLAGEVGIPYGILAPYMFAVDGWSWNEHVFRSPIWMNDHRDVPIDEARKIEGLEWLNGSSLEIKLRPKEG